MLLLLLLAAIVVVVLLRAASRGVDGDCYDKPNWRQNHPRRELIARGRRDDESRHFYFHVHGTRRRYGKQVNPHYSERQDAIRHCTRGDPLVLLREPSNQYDPNAILVRLTDGEDAGYVPSETAAVLAPQLDAGEGVRAEVDWINPPEPGFGYGLKVRVGILLSDAELQAKIAKRGRKGN